MKTKIKALAHDSSLFFPSWLTLVLPHVTSLGNVSNKLASPFLSNNKIYILKHMVWKKKYGLVSEMQLIFSGQVILDIYSFIFRCIPFKAKIFLLEIKW